MVGGECACFSHSLYVSFHSNTLILSGQGEQNGLSATPFQIWRDARSQLAQGRRNPERYGTGKALSVKA